MNRKGTLAVLMAAAGYGTASIFGKLAFAQGLDTYTVLTIRYSLAAVILWGYLIATRQHRPLDKKNRQLVFLAALLGNILVPILYFQGLQRLPISLFAILSYTYPSFVIAFSWLFLKEKLQPYQWTSLALTMTGCAVMYWSRQIHYDLLGIFLALGASVSYSLYILGLARNMQTLSPARAMTYTISAAAAAFIIYGAVTGALRPPSPTGWALLGGMAIFSTAAASIAFFTGIQLIGPSRAALISTVEPIFTIVLAMLVFNETITSQQALGAGLVILALLILHGGTPRMNPAGVERK